MRVVIILIYLDNAATSAQKPLIVFGKLFKESLFTSINAGRGAHRKSLKAIEGINKTAELTAKLFNISDSSRIAFLPNATYALNLGILGVLKPDDHVIVTSMEHNSVLRPVTQKGNFTVVPADNDGFVPPEHIEQAIRPSTTLIVCTHASNVCGTVQDAEAIGKIAKKHKILFMLDCAQTAGCMKIDAEKIGADMIAFSGHKGIMGPLGTGGLYVSPEIELSPVITGGTGSFSESLIQPSVMPDMLHSGTMNAPAIMALGTAIECISDYTDEIFLYERKLAESFIEDLKNMNNIYIYGTDLKNRNGTVSFNIKNTDPAEIEDYFDREKKIIIRSGYHCAPLAHKTLGTEKTGTARVSFGYYSTDKHRKAASDAVYDFMKSKNMVW